MEARISPALFYHASMPSGQALVPRVPQDDLSAARQILRKADFLDPVFSSEHNNLFPASQK